PYPYVAPVAGAAEFTEVKTGAVYTLAVLQKFQENQGDAWAFTQSYLEGALRAQETAADPALEAERTAQGAARLALLAQRVAELHRAFARPTGDPAFDPELVDAQEFSAWRSTVLEDAARTLDMLQRMRADLPTEALAGVEALLGARARLAQQIAGLKIVAQGLAKTRLHGDLHLGQVLIAQDDFVIIDFEGEPARPIEERRQKHSPLRDVAGMLRSLSYASHAAAAKPASVRPVPTHFPGQRGLRPPALEAWETRAAAVFLQAYRAAAAGLASIPSEDRVFDALLQLFMLEKVLYEIRYEAGNRPDWLPIPVTGLLGMLRA